MHPYMTTELVRGAPHDVDPLSLTGQVAGVCSMSGSRRQLAATSAGVR